MGRNRDDDAKPSDDFQKKLDAGGITCSRAGLANAMIAKMLRTPPHIDG